jgi:iron complex outermembrane receptor protein
VVDAAVFLTDYDNLVEPKIDTDGRIVFRNITRARITGAEIGVMTSLLDRLLELGAGWTYMDPRDRNMHTVLKYRPRHLLYGSATVNRGMFSLSADVRWISRVEAIDEELAIAIQNGDERVATFVTDARLTADLRALALPFTATFAVNNLFQYNYVEIVGNLAPIRNFRLTVEAAF